MSEGIFDLIILISSKVSHPQVILVDLKWSYEIKTFLTIIEFTTDG